LKFPIKQSKKSTKTALIFLDKNSKAMQSEKKVDIILSPSLYWFREELLPVKGASQAKKLAPSLFDAVIPEGTYSYLAQKNGDTFWLFAFNDAEIAKAISNAGLRVNQIQNIYFAQNECEKADKALKVNENFALVNNEGTISLLPLRYIAESMDAQTFFEMHKRSKHKISINLFQNTLVDEKQLNRLIAIAIVFIFIYLGAYLMQQQQFKKVLTQQHALNESYQLPQTSFQLKGLIKALESKQKRQLSLRSHLKKLFKLSLKKGEYIKKFDVNIKKYTLEIVLKDAKHAEGIKTQLQKSSKITSAKVKKKIFYVSGTYE